MGEGRREGGNHFICFGRAISISSSLLLPPHPFFIASVSFSAIYHQGIQINPTTSCGIEKEENGEGVKNVGGEGSRGEGENARGTKKKKKTDTNVGRNSVVQSDVGR